MIPVQMLRSKRRKSKRMENPLIGITKQRSTESIINIKLQVNHQTEVQKKISQKVKVMITSLDVKRIRDIRIRSQAEERRESKIQMMKVKKR